jgi:hypothetical protein
MNSNYRFALSGILGAWAALAMTSASAQDEGSKGALETDPTGWTDILPGKDLQGWKRVALPPGSALKAKNPWKVDSDAKLLVCDGVGLHENLHYDKELADVIFHVEWRFQKIEGGKGYNSGVYVRNSDDAKIWHQAQVGSKNIGYLFGDSPAGGQMKRFKTNIMGPQRGREAGEWNTYEITCKGKTITLWVNGFVTSEWNDCEVPKGYIGLEAEYFLIEFKNLKIKELK